MAGLADRALRQADPHPATRDMVEGTVDHRTQTGDEGRPSIETCPVRNTAPFAVRPPGRQAECRRRFARIALAVLMACGSAPSGAIAGDGKLPRFQVDDQWMKLPAQWRLGDVSAVDVDRQGRVYVLHRPRSLVGEDRARAAPPVLVFAPDGTFLSGWGGPGTGYEWPDTEHSLAVDARGHVWIAGNARPPAGAGDDMLLEFDARHRLVRQLGRKGASRGDGDTRNLNAPGDLVIDDVRHEVYIADGYGNRRVVVYDSRTGRFKRMWSAFGAVPPADPAPAFRPKGAPFAPEDGPGPAGFNGVHGVEVARDGLVYVSDRNNQRVQVFTRAGRYLKQVFVNRNRPSAQTASGLAVSADRAQRYLYVADWGNSELLVYDRISLLLLGRIAAPGEAPGQVTTPHLIAVDRRGRLYVAEVKARRVQRFTPEPTREGRR